MDQKEYAAHRGVSQPLIAKYIRQGKLNGAFTKAGRKYNIDPKKADAALDKEQAPRLKSQPTARETHTAPPAKKTGTYHEASTQEKWYKVALLKQTYEKNAGDLIDKKEVLAGYAKVIVAAKTKILSVQSKVAPLIKEAIADPEIAADIIRTIDEVHREALNDLAGAGE